MTVGLRGVGALPSTSRDLPGHANRFAPPPRRASRGRLALAGASLAATATSGGFLLLAATARSGASHDLLIVVAIALAAIAAAFGAAAATPGTLASRASARAALGWTLRVAAAIVVFPALWLLAVVLTIFVVPAVFIVLPIVLAFRHSA